PTGSGKTTTLYAALSRLNEGSRNIMTVEDPIEYFIDGIAQTQVNPKVDMSFARGLRAILRQDPDVVMVGEIRDLETAQIAIQASLTGHMVFSTLHTNTAIGAITRLRDMGAEPFLLASSLVGVLAQRLIRVLCKHCREPHVLDPLVAARMGSPQVAHANSFAAAGCALCNHTGYRGRTAIYELVTFDNPMRQLIHDGVSEAVLESHARQDCASIMDSGVNKVLDGTSTPEELLRVMQSI
ncbi:MAG: GspE/PulE family protein, partial [Gammaproteobacteria bacterium]